MAPEREASLAARSTTTTRTARITPRGTANGGATDDVKTDRAWSAIVPTRPRE
jgi:hypothetical protein